ncbi:hypothetical protein KPH14_002649 [Odynerus spinipes]|uniref:Uncharacterized protein n=1 Tax=Odynerus spinipes TaxID=1348599 RepID=A0AAD9VMR6_9HYME|nr:hypothetical protein KPH14_002649 [Odynerus spinipes]
MATDWHVLSFPIGLIGGIASLSLYQNLRRPPVERNELVEKLVDEVEDERGFDAFDLLASAVPPFDSPHRRISKRARAYSLSVRSSHLDDGLPIVVVLGSCFRITAIVLVDRPASCFKTGRTLASVQTSPSEAGLNRTITRRAVFACGPISRLPG